MNLRQSNGLGIKVHSSIWDPRGFVLDAAVPGGNWNEKKPVQTSLKVFNIGKLTT